MPAGIELRCGRVAVDGHAPPGPLRLADPAVDILRLHRHRDRPRWRQGVRSRGGVRQPLPGRAATGRRAFISCGAYEPFIVRNRAMERTFRSIGMEVQYVESRDSHNWENWRDRLPDALSFVFPGPQWLYYKREGRGEVSRMVVNRPVGVRHHPRSLGGVRHAGAAALDGRR